MTNRQIIEDRTMTPEQLLRSAKAGDEIWAPIPEGHITVPACLKLLDGRFVMWGLTGTHSIAAEPHITDAERLHAHWKGFKEIATAKLTRRAA